MMELCGIVEAKEWFSERLIRQRLVAERFADYHMAASYKYNIRSVSFMNIVVERQTEIVHGRNTL